MDGRLRAVQSSVAASVEHTTALVGGVGRQWGTKPPVTQYRSAVCRNACGSGREGPVPQALQDPGIEAPDPAAGEPKHPGDGRAWFLKGDGGGSSTGGAPSADPAVERGSRPRGAESVHGRPWEARPKFKVTRGVEVAVGGRWRARGRGSPLDPATADQGRVRSPGAPPWGRPIRPRERRIRWGGSAGGLRRRGPGQEAAVRRACPSQAWGRGMRPRRRPHSPLLGCAGLGAPATAGGWGEDLRGGGGGGWGGGGRGRRPSRSSSEMKCLESL
ncbi:hypothetical protein PVAP13_6NG335301 [Panicum virgatum]|uniref:Uncharacterized protein n=1 Tax=Panicum virgatum TaxID=38727 RepID=A0A8T0R5D8_PANVG|nr:hypothetical protein PVAP13_6NG335301 [Panicum virgatum]